jgi:hypothetical protein
MSGGGWQMVHVPQAAPLQCPVQPCPYCAVALPHNATTDDVLARCKQMTTDTNTELNRIVSSYTLRCGAARNILRLHDTARKLPAAQSMFDLVGPALCRDYSCYMAPLIDPLGQMPPPPPDGEHPLSPPAAAGPHPSTGSGSTPQGLKRWMDVDEFPQWQYQGGKRKNKWSPYEHSANQHLEGAYQAGAIMVELVIDDWNYTVDLRDMTQTNSENGTIRRVRRVEETEREP